MDAFVHLRVHTEYSLNDGIGRVKDLPARARELGMPALAITDAMNFYGAVKFHRQCVEHGVKPLIGVDLRLLGRDDGAAPDRLVVLCRNNRGLKFLNRVLTRAYLGPRPGHRLGVELEWLTDGARDLVALSAGLDGELGRALTSAREDEAGRVLDRYLEVFGERFCIDVHRVGLPDEDEYVYAALDLGERRGVPVVATNPVQFLGRDDFDAHDMRVCIGEGRVLNDSRRVRRFTEQQFLRGPEDLRRLFPESRALIANTVEIARQCNVSLGAAGYHMPAYPDPDGLSSEERLKADARAGLERRLREFANDAAKTPDEVAYRERLELELEIIIGMGFAGYFLIVADFIAWARRNGIPVGPGRGSGAGSLVAWVIGITDLDPLEYGLLFERFLNPERVSPPDFDIDFCMDRRDEVIEYVSQRYGRERVSQIITFGSMAARAVVKDVGRVMGLSYGFFDTLSKLVPFEVGITLNKALVDEPELKRRYDEEEEVATLIDAARRLEGLPRNVGKHAGGVVIAPDDISEHVALYMEPGMAQPATQFDKDDLEAIGLVKFDFLGLRTLTVIHNAVEMVNESRERPLDVAHVPLDDAPTYELIKSGRTTGVFQLESRGMTELVLRLLPDRFEDLMALLALFRPGPLKSGMVDDFIDRRHGRESIVYPHPDLEHVLKPTYGVILYQEQVMRIAQVLSGYTLGAADLLREAMGKKKKEEMARQRPVFVDGAVERGVDARTAERIFGLIEEFAGYGFNKSHSAGYALLTYQTAWLKTHYPAEFMAASLTADIAHADKVVTLVAETRGLKLEVFPPDVNRCGATFRPARGQGVFYGLGALKYVGRRAAEEIVAERERNGAYRDLFDFCARADARLVNKQVIEALVRGGALDCLGETRATLAANLSAAVKHAERRARDAASGQSDLFGGDPEVAEAARPQTLPEWSEARRLAAEKEILGLYLTGHPFAPLRSELDPLCDARLAALKPSPARVVLAAGLVSQVRVMKSRGNERVAFLTLDDNTARIEVKVLSRLFAARKALIRQDAVLIVRGVAVDDDYTGGLQVRAAEIYDLSTVRREWLSRIEIEHAEGADTGASLDWLVGALRDDAPGARVTLCYRRANGDYGEARVADRWRLCLDEDLKEALEARFGGDNVRYRYNRAAVLAVDANRPQVAA